MLGIKEIKNKNLLENADFRICESKLVTNFLESECDKCGNKIKFRLGMRDVKDVEEYIKLLEAKLNEYELREQKLIGKLEEDKKEHTYSVMEIDAIGYYIQGILEIYKKEK